MRYPPTLWPPDHLPDADVIAVLYANLTGIKFNVDAWEAALELYKFAKSSPIGVKSELARKWKFIAAHECVMQLSHLRHRMEFIRASGLRDCGSIVNHVDNGALRNAVKLFDGHFPEIEEFRHAIAHIASVDRVGGEHALPHGFALFGFPNGDRFQGPYQGKLRYLDLTDETLGHITRLVSMFFEGFVEAEKELARLGGSA